MRASTNSQAFLGSNARSLLKFVTALDGKTLKKNLLSANLQAVYASGSSVSTSSGLVIGIWGNRLYFYSALPRTRSCWIIDIITGLSAAVIFNGNIDYTNGALNQEFALAVQDVLVNLVTNNMAYKNIDQF